MRRQADVVELLGALEGHEPGAHGPRSVPVLALRHVEFRMAHPVAQGAFIAERQRGDVLIGIRLAYAASALADHHGHLALIVELRRLGRADERLAMARE